MEADDDYDLYHWRKIMGRTKEASTRYDTFTYLSRFYVKHLVLYPANPLTTMARPED